MADHVYDTEYATAEFTACGELQMMDKLAQYQFNTIFDVGANIGEWAKMVIPKQPQAQVHCFEPMPTTFRNLLKNIDLERVTPNPFGLSNECSIMDMLFSAENDRLTTPCLELMREEPEIVPLIMIDGMNYCRSRKVETIDFLKIDTEGHEFKVLKGFEPMLQEGKIAIIQFEYGYANVLTKDLLLDFYKMLIPMGYQLGLQTPNGVLFKEYGLFDENFRGPNYVAVHNSSPDLMATIQVK